MLVAWQIDDGDDDSDNQRNAAQRNRPYRFIVPSTQYPSLAGALPAMLACYGSVAVSVWFPANYRYTRTGPGPDDWKRVSTEVNHRLVVVWDLITSETRVFSIPDVLSCVSPDCRFVAYCDTDRKRLIVVDVATGETSWEGPDERDQESWKNHDMVGGVAEIRFSEDGGMLLVGYIDGAVDIFEVKMRRHGAMGRY
jgi:hypothetical protein